MIATCPLCERQYELPPRSKLGRHTTVRCQGCERVFSVDEALSGPSELTEPDVLDDPTEKEVEEEAAMEDDDEIEQDDERPKKKRARKASADDDTPRGTSAAQFALRAVFGVTLGYAVLSIYLVTHPERVRSVLGSIPIVGDQLTQTKLGPEQIQLTEVKGEYRRVQGDALVFVLSGVAINNAPIPVRAVQIKGRVIGGREDSVAAFCGTQPHDVERYSVPELNMLQSLERPPAGWVLGPGQQAPFLLVFTNPPPALREFTAEVATVQRTRPDEATGA